MKTLELTGPTSPSLPEVLAMAQQESLIVRTASGEEFFIGVMDDFEHELNQLSESSEFQQLLRERQKERGVIPVETIRARLG